MPKGLYQFLRQAWKKPKESLGEVLRERLAEWRDQNVVTRAERPTRLDRAREVGYKAKLGYSIIRVRVKKGGRRRRKPEKGRNPKHSGLVHFTPKGLQWIAEEKAQRKFSNLEVLNSYWIGEDGEYKFFEIILADPTKVQLTALNRTGRAFRGLTSQGRKSRGLGRGRQGTNRQRVKD